MYSEDNIKKVVNTIRDSIQPDKIYLFGSYAAGNPKEDSDIDICIIKNNVQDKNEELVKVKKKAYYLGIPMDILLLNESFDDCLWASR